MKSFLLIQLLLLSSVKGRQQMAGGIGEEHPADAEVQRYVDKLTPQIKQKIEAVRGTFGSDASNGPTFQAISYKSQVVSGTNYFVKVLVKGSNEYWHLRIYRHWSGDPLEVSSVSGPKEASHPITYFP